MDRLCILVANEHRSDREAIAGAVRLLRPDLDVLAVEPEALDGTVIHHSPHLVVCGRATLTVQSSVLTWVELYPREEPLVVISIAGQYAAVAEFTLSDLLSLIEQTERLAFAR